MVALKMVSAYSVAATRKLCLVSLWLWVLCAALMLAAMALCVVVWPFAAVWGLAYGDDATRTTIMSNFAPWVLCTFFMAGVFITSRASREGESDG